MPKTNDDGQAALSRRAALRYAAAAGLVACESRAPSTARTIMQPSIDTAASARRIELRTRGSRHGFIRRMVSPGDIGELIKPFIFLDHIAGETRPGMGFPYHPHSGIATVSYVLDADGTYEDTTGKSGILRAGGVEWMMSGSGVWHRGGVVDGSSPRVTGFQLWVAMPPTHEEAEAESHYIAPGEIPEVDGVRVLLGSYRGLRSPVPVPNPMTYLDVNLGPSQRWQHQPPETHDVAWVFVHQGTALVQGQATTDTLVVFERGHGPLDIVAQGGPARVLVGTAEHHPHPLVLGTSSVHTARAPLERSLRRIGELGMDLRRRGLV
ncbi:MAG: pirin family protein [Myxococcales bacterium]|nr:pirin family protein [Myxococcales bacterium]